jgi:hypothetical protein
MDLEKPKEQIITQIDPNVGSILITIPPELVKVLGWSSNSSIVYIADPEQSTLIAKLAK